MKKAILALAVLSLAAYAFAEEMHVPKPHALFDKLKPLVGTWQGTAGGEKVTTSYTLVAGGSALMENLMPETAGMVDMIHPDGDALMFTHYCAGANQPRYRATKFDGNSIDFKFVDGTNIGDSFMSGVKITLVDADHINQVWTSREKGKETQMTFELTRVK